MGVKSYDKINRIKTAGDADCVDLGPRVMWSVMYFLFSRDISPIVMKISKGSDVESKDRGPRVMWSVMI